MDAALAQLQTFSPKFYTITAKYLEKTFNWNDGKDTCDLWFICYNRMEIAGVSVQKL